MPSTARLSPTSNRTGASNCRSISDWLQDGLDFGVDGYVGGGKAVDGEWSAGILGEMEEARDVIVLVVSGEEALVFRMAQPQAGKSHGDAKFQRDGEIAIH